MMPIGKKLPVRMGETTIKHKGVALALLLAIAGAPVVNAETPADCSVEGNGQSVWSVTDSEAGVECNAEHVGAEEASAKEGIDDSPFWQFPALTGDYEGQVLIDTDPGSRGYAEERLVNKLNYRYNKVNRANRVHIEYGPDDTEPSESSLQLIHSVIDHMAQDGDRLVITGYESQDNGMRIAKIRVDALVAKLNFNKDVYIEKDATGFWPGVLSEGDRVEVFLIPRL
jgi:hypothetical protein